MANPPPPTLLEPTPLSWSRALPPSLQTDPSIPPTFRDAMAVRTAVFVQEQNIPQENEYDADDARCAHWVLYSDPAETTTPIGTIRLVPFPHPPHPVPGGVYVDGILVSSPSNPESQPPAHEEEQQEEPYLKLGRLAILPSHRRSGHAATLIRTALSWARANPSYFDLPQPSPTTSQAAAPPRRRWNGIVLCHAQVDAVKVWERCGFRVDEAMGRWYEEGIEHVGCVLRLDVDRDGEGV